MSFWAVAYESRLHARATRKVTDARAQPSKSSTTAVAIVTVTATPAAAARVRTDES